MKRVLSFLLCVLLLSGCAVKKPVIKNEENKLFYGIWITYSELEDLLSNDFENSFNKICENAKSLGATAIFVHTRAFSDSIYPSQLFPIRNYLASLPFDPLDKMLSIAKNYSLEFHAWINPYRVSFKNDIDALDANSPARRYEGILLNNTNGLYLDPSSEKARGLIIDGIKEICENYDIDGIHFDDYFYPTTDERIDSKSYAAYKSSADNPLPLDLWRKANVTLLIADTSRYLKSRNIAFTLSPAADIDKNKNEFYADVENWCSMEYFDAIIPQLYFGFDYPLESFSFDSLLDQWISLKGKSATKLYIGLAPYKLDIQNVPDSTEWKNGTDIVARQLSIIKQNENTDGAVLFSYSYLFNEKQNYIKQKQEIIKIIKE